MQIATLNYQYNPKEKFHSDSKSKYQHRHILTTITNPTKKSKQQRSFLPDLTTNSHAVLPPIKTTNKRPSSIRIKGSGLQSSKLNEASISAVHPSSRSRSRQSDKTDILGTRSRSITPSRTGRLTSKFVNLKFGHPVKIRSADFYAPDLTESELRLREESFVNDSIRIANQSIPPSKVPHYQAFDDPNLKQFFQSSLVLNVVRKTLNIDLDERLSDTKKRSKPIDRDAPYHGIIAKHSSGYGKLNGYNCLPSYVSTHHHRSIKPDRHQSSANSSLKSFPTYNSFQSQPKPKYRPNKKSQKLTSIVPIRHRTAATNDTAAASSVSQD